MGRLASGEFVQRWRAVVDGWRRSGFSIVECCRREGNSQASFFGWRKRLAGENAGRGGTRRVKGADGAGRFAQLSPSAWPQASGVRIALPSGAGVTACGRPCRERRGSVPALSTRPRLRRNHFGRRANRRRHQSGRRIDIRKSFSGLHGVIVEALGQDPLSGDWLGVVNRRRDRIKIMAWEGDGFAIW